MHVNVSPRFASTLKRQPEHIHCFHLYFYFFLFEKVTLLKTLWVDVLIAKIQRSLKTILTCVSLNWLHQWIADMGAAGQLNLISAWRYCSFYRHRMLEKKKNRSKGVLVYFSVIGLLSSIQRWKRGTGYTSNELPALARPEEKHYWYSHGNTAGAFSIPLQRWIQFRL